MKPNDATIAPSPAKQGLERGRLFRKYFLLILGLVCGALLLSGGIGLYFSYEENKNALAAVQREKAIGAAARIEQFVRQIEQQLAHAALPQLGASGMEQRRLEFDKLIRIASEVTDVAHIDARGREQLAVSRLSMNVPGSNRDRSEEPAFKNAKPDQAWFSPVYFRKETEPYMSIAVRAGGPAGAVTVADVNLKFMWDVVTRIKVGKKGKAYVVDGTGHLVADPDIGLVLRKTDLSQLPQVREALEKGAPESDAMVAKDMAGGSVLTAYASIDAGSQDSGGRKLAPLGWKVFVEQPTAEVFETLNATIIRTISLIVAGLLISALAALWLARSMVRPIRTLQEGAARIGAGDLGQDIHIRTGDELEALANQFNQMSAQLRESYADLEQKVEKRTRELTESLEQQTATSEILRVISSSPGDLKPVFDAILEYALRLCEANMGILGLYDGKFYQTATHRGANAAYGKWLDERGPFEPGTVMALGRMINERRPMMVADLKESDGYRQGQPVTVHTVDVGGAKTYLAVPMLKDERVLGGIAIYRSDVKAFTDQQINLVSIFANQAAIAIENARLFREIQDKSQQLEIANRHKSEFLANMSHELRTPLNAIIGFSEVLVEKMFGEVNEKQLDYLKDIHSSGKHLLSLINDILDLSKIEAGRMELDLADFDPRLALQNAMTLVKERAQRSGVALSLDADAAPENFRADERKFKQIMLNLLSNAVKFTPEGGKVSVRARAVEGALEVAVQDTGVGIAVEDQEAVFEEFRQVGRDYTRKAEGTGLGLALTKRFIELHGGTVRLESAPGKGSTFTFTIPAQP